MSEILFASPRAFVTWQYSASWRGRLLLRSSKMEPYSTRIDMHFMGVEAMALRPSYDGLIIRRASVNEVRRIQGESGVDNGPEYIFILSEGEDDSRVSYVCSGKPQWHEDDGEDDDPSWFPRMPGTAGPGWAK